MGGPDIRRQELHCHACQKYVQFDLDLSMNGNHVLNCPNCRHEHCRVVKDGKITGERWGQRNGGIIPISHATTSGTSTFDTYSGSTLTYGLWMDGTTSAT